LFARKPNSMMQKKKEEAAVKKKQEKLVEACDFDRVVI